MFLIELQTQVSQKEVGSESVHKLDFSKGQGGKNF